MKEQMFKGKWQEEKKEDVQRQQQQMKEGNERTNGNGKR